MHSLLAPLLEIGTRLNPDQLKAVTHRDGPMLIVAGAGTGKTRILEYRVLNLVMAGVDPANILLLTFTREAAREMLSRAAAVDFRCQSVQGGTFHSFALKMLRQQAERLKKSFTITVLDDDEALEILRDCLGKVSLTGGLKSLAVQDLYKVICRSQTYLISLKQALSDEYPDLGNEHLGFEALRDTFNKEKFKYGFCTYNDLLIEFRNLLRFNDYLENFSREYRYIMVDEYQDTNRLQAALVQDMAALHKNILVVGDDAQSIFGFNGANPRGLLEFEKKFGADKKIVLKTNYRSIQYILDLANAITYNMTDIIPRQLQAYHNFRGIKMHPWLCIFRDEQEEARWIAERILLNRNENKVPLNEQCVLFRSTYISNILQAELQARRIPYVLKGGRRFIDMPHVKDVLAFFRILRKPADILAWKRVLQLEPSVPKRIKDIYQFVESFAQKGEDIRTILDMEWPVTSTVKALIGKNSADIFIADLRKLFGELLPNKNKPHYLAEKIIKFYEPFLFNRYGDFAANKKDLESLEILAKSYDSIEEFIDIMSMEPPHRATYVSKSAADDDEPKLVLSTIHSAKGREWNTVYLMGVLEGQLPDYRSMNDEEKLGEEHRLLYVAVTRAKVRLYLTMHENQGKGSRPLAKLSPFVAAENVFECLTINKMSA